VAAITAADNRIRRVTVDRHGPAARLEMRRATERETITGLGDSGK
jgi:hypothetical protein